MEHDEDSDRSRDISHACDSDSYNRSNEGTNLRTNRSSPTEKEARFKAVSIETNRNDEAGVAGDKSLPTNYNPLFLCEICQDGNSNYIVPATSSCKDCSELYCDTCTFVHRKQKATSDHNVVNLNSLGSRIYCNSCQDDDLSVRIAEFICIDCDEIQCRSCNIVHMKQKATRNHNVISCTYSTKQLCHPKGTSNEQTPPASDDKPSGSIVCTTPSGEQNATRLGQTTVKVENVDILSSERQQTDSPV
jgi:hypothetical protein